MKTPLLAFLFLMVANLALAQNEVTSPGFFFSPANLTVDEGTTVTFTLGSMHNAVEVANSSSTTPNGGFSIPNGGGTHIFDTPGVYHYICTNHTSMRGTITVEAVTGIKSKNSNLASLEINPNPVTSVSAVSFTLNNSAEVEVVLYNNMGVKAMSLGKQSYSSGEQKVNLDVTALENGLYTAAVLIEDVAIASKKIMINK